MTTLAIWFFGTWVALLAGTALAIVGLDIWINHRREAMRQSQEALK